MIPLSKTARRKPGCFRERKISLKYEHLLAPLKIGNVTLKNRILGSKCVSSDNMEPPLSGPFYEHLARNGAAWVCVGVGAYPDCEGNYSKMAPCHMDDPKAMADYREIVEKIHRHGSLASASLMAIEPQNVNISDTPNWDEIPMTGDYSQNLFNKPGISPERLEGMIQDFVHASVELQKLGFDGVTVYASYRGSILACSLSPLLNQRTDKYGGKTMADRATLTLPFDICVTDITHWFCISLPQLITADVLVPKICAPGTSFAMNLARSTASSSICIAVCMRTSISPVCELSRSCSNVSASLAFEIY